MDSATLLYNFRIGFDIIASGAAPGFTDTQVYSILNRAEDELVLKAITEKDFISINTILVDSSVGISGGTDKLYYRALPADYWMYIESHSGLTRTALGNSGFFPTLAIASEKQITNEYIEAEQAINFLASSFNSLRIFKAPKSYVLNGNLYVIADDYTTIINIILRYIRKRTLISSSATSELPEVMHRLIVDKAIDIAKVIINSQNPQ